MIFTRPSLYQFLLQCNVFLKGGFYSAHSLGQFGKVALYGICHTDFYQVHTENLLVGQQCIQAGQILLAGSKGNVCHIRSDGIQKGIRA